MLVSFANARRGSVPATAFKKPGLERYPYGWGLDDMISPMHDETVAVEDKLTSQVQQVMRGT
jgi:hypothetical protein